jgi:hypothetical protein
MNISSWKHYHLLCAELHYSTPMTQDCSLRLSFEALALSPGTKAGLVTGRAKVQAFKELCISDGDNEGNMHFLE